MYMKCIVYLSIVCKCYGEIHYWKNDLINVLATRGCKRGGGLVRLTYPFPNLAFGELGIALGVNRVVGKGHVHVINTV